MATPTFRSARSTASATCSVSLMPLLSLSGITLFGTDSRSMVPPPPGGVTTLAKLQRKLIDAPLSVNWSSVRNEDVPSHQRLAGVVSSAKRAAAPA